MTADGVGLPSPYYDHAGITIFHADCRDILPHLNPVDLVLTDPPYPGLVGGYDRFVGACVGEVATPSRAIGDEWGASLDWVPLAMDCARLGALVFCSYHALPEVALAFKWRRAILLAWHKRNAGHTGKNVPRFTEEYIWGFARRPGLKWDVFTTTLIDIPRLATGCMASPERITGRNGRAEHPTQKPLAVIRHLLSVGGDTILDPFMGSGTTLRAAKDLGRKAIGIEIEERYCEIAARRLAQEVLPFGGAR